MIAVVLGVLVALGVFATKPTVTATRPLVTSPSIGTDLSVAVLPFDDLSWNNVAAGDASWRLNHIADAEREIAVYISQHPEDPGKIAVFYACRPDADATVAWLAKYAARHQGESMTLPNRMACFRKVESDPRYQELIRKIREDKPPRSSPN